MTDLSFTAHPLWDGEILPINPRALIDFLLIMAKSVIVCCMSIAYKKYKFLKWKKMPITTHTIDHN